MKPAGEPQYSSSSGCMLTVEEPYPHLVGGVSHHHLHRILPGELTPLALQSSWRRSSSCGISKSIICDGPQVLMRTSVTFTARASDSLTSDSHSQVASSWFTHYSSCISLRSPSSCSRAGTSESRPAHPRSASALSHYYPAGLRVVLLASTLRLRYNL